MMGCADCYKVFYDKLKPSLSRIHGRAIHAGKTGASFTESSALEYRITELKEQMQAAVNSQNFEEAAKLRDEIRDLGGDSSNG